MTVELPAEVRARLDGHLDAVEKTLMAAGRSREQRRAVVDDLEAQILDMLAKRSVAPTLADMNEVLMGLDPPEAYVDGPARATPAPSAGSSPARLRYSRTAIAGLICILVSLIPVGLGFVIVALYGQHVSPPVAAGVKVPIGQYERDPVTGNWKQNVIEMAPGSGGEGPPAKRTTSLKEMLCMVMLAGPLGLAGTVLGWIAYGQIRSSRGMIQGKGLALFDGLFYPLLTPICLVLMS